MRNIRGWERWRGNLRRLQGDARQELRAAVEASAKETAGLVKSLAPRDEGDLAASVDIVPGSHDLALRVRAGGQRTTRVEADGDAYDYSRAAEFGPNGAPFFFPVVRAQRKAHRARVSRAVNRAIKKAMS
jgi:hypothetical protein